MSAPAPAAAPKQPKARAAISSHVEIYGMSVPRDTPRMAVELGCYRDHRPKEHGGLGDEEHFKRAFRLMWPTYEWSDWVELIVWAWCNHKWIIIIGHERASKTFTSAHCALLDYMAEPMAWDKYGNGTLVGGTLTSLATVTFEGLKLRMWSDLMRAVETAKGMQIAATLQIRSTTNEMSMYPHQSSRESGEKYKIHGMAVNQSKDAEGRIRGGHAPRRRILLDEAQNIADPIFQAVINPMSAPEAKCVMLTNPVEKISRFGEWCEPEGGWGSINDTDLVWNLKKFKDGVCLHLDGLQSPNVKSSKTIFTGLLTKENVEEVKRVHGMDSVQWWSLIRGFFPPDGIVARVFPNSVIEKSKPALIFDFRPEMCASLDPAFEQDNCVLHFAQLGRPIFGVKRYSINCLETVVVKYTVSPGSMPKDYQLANSVIAECKSRGIKPEHFIMDGSGGGRGVAAILQKEWSQEIQVVQYGGASTDRPLRADNSQKCCDLYKFFVSELWFRASEYCRDGLICGLGNLDKRTEEDLSARRYEVKTGTKCSMQQVEIKADMKDRIGRSPDFGDAFCQFGELLVRLGTFVGSPTPGMPNSATSKWDRQRQRVKAIGARHSDAKEFSYG